MTTFNVAIIGLGNIGMLSDLHLSIDNYTYSHARAFNQHENFKLVAGIDSNEESLKTYKIHYPGKTYKTITNKLTDLKIDVVAISLPTQHHYTAFCEIISVCKPRIIICEKPLSYNVAEAEEMIKQCNKLGIELYVNYIRRADTATQEIKDMIDNEIIQLPVKGIVWYSKGLIHNGSHFFDLLNYWLGEAKQLKVISSGLQLDDDYEPDIKVSFQENICYFLAAKEENYSHYTIELVATNGRLRYDQGGAQVTWQGKKQSKTLVGYTYLNTISKPIDTNLDHIQLQVVHQIFNALNNNKTSLCTGIEALQTLKHLTSIGNT